MIKDGNFVDFSFNTLNIAGKAHILCDAASDATNGTVLRDMQFILIIH